MTVPSSGRRHIDLSALEEYVRLLKPNAGIVRGDSRKKTIAIPKEDLVPVIQADVGSAVPVDVYPYRLLLPIAQIVNGVRVALDGIEVDIDTLEETFTRHFGGMTCQTRRPSHFHGVGARDPANVRATLERNEHAVFEVYAAPIHASDEYFRAVRRELQEALQEGVILIERQQVTLL